MQVSFHECAAKNAVAIILTGSSSIAQAHTPTRRTSIRASCSGCRRKRSRWAVGGGDEVLPLHDIPHALLACLTAGGARTNRVYRPSAALKTTGRKPLILCRSIGSLMRASLRKERETAVIRLMGRFDFGGHREFKRCYEQALTRRRLSRQLGARDVAAPVGESLGPEPSDHIAPLQWVVREILDVASFDTMFAMR